MAKPIIIYDDGRRATLAGSATGQLPTWNNATGEWTAALPALVPASGIVGGGAGTAGYFLKTTDGTTVEWAAVPGGGSGTVTSVSAGTGISVTGDNTVNPTINLAALGVDPSGTFGDAATVAQVTVDAYGRVTAASGVAIAISASAITSGTLELARGGLGIDASGVTSGQLLIGGSAGGTLALKSVSGDATLTDLGVVTVTGLQGYDVSSAAPATGDVLIWSGTEYVSVPLPAGGSGGGGVIYFFNQATNASGTGLPGSTYQLGRSAQAAYSSITKSSISTGGWDRVGGFVTDAGDPNISTLPTGVWDLNLWATTASAVGNVRSRFVLYAYDNATDPELGVAIATSSEVEMFDQGGAAQYVASLVVPASVSLSGNKRLYLKLEVRASIASQSVEFGFGDAAPSHTHTTVPSVTGTGIVKVLNSVIVATGQQVDLSTAAAEVTGALPLANGGTGGTDAPTARSSLGAAASGANSDITSITGLTTPLTVGQGGTGAATTTANTVFAGPTSGGAAAPGFRALVAADLPVLPYDLSGEYPGGVSSDAEVFHFIAVRPFTIKAQGANPSYAYAGTVASGGSVQFTMTHYPAAGGTDAVGSYSFADGASTATFTISADKTFQAGDRLVVTAPTNTRSIGNVYWTFFAVTA